MEEARKFLERKLEEVWKHFLAEARDAGGLHDLRPLQYHSGEGVDYQSALQRDWYLLRYLLGYLAEYWLVYSELVHAEFLSPPLRVASIGCGCGIDLWALELACAGDQYQIYKNAHYTGFDLAEWEHVEPTDRDRVRFLFGRDVLTLKTLGTPYNVVIFGKSLSELDKHERGVERLCTILAKTRYGGDCIAIAVSSTNRAAARHKEILEQVARVLSRAQGFAVLDEMTRGFSGAECGQKLKDLCTWACPYPEDIYKEMQDLCAICANAGGGRGACRRCAVKNAVENQKSWKPITTPNEMRYQILFLKRNGGGGCSGKESPF